MLDGVAETISGSTWFATSATHTWTHGSGVISINGQQGGHRFLNPQTTVTSEGQVVKVRFEVVDITAGTLNLSYSTGPATSGASVSYGDSNGFYEFVNVVTGNNLVYFRAESDFAGSIRNISFEVVDTLVDLTPQSASSSKWRNEALLGFYDGTVNNATLSQGNSYWNNIKQDATDTTVAGEFTVVPTASEKGITIGDGTKGEVSLIFKGGSGSHSIGQNGGNFFISETSTGNLDSSARLSTDGLNVKIHNKLGVGTAADASIQMTVGGAGSQVMQVKSTDSHASVQIDRKNATADANLMLLTNGVSKWRLATGLAGNDEKLSIYDDIANTNMMVFKTAVGVGVGPSFGTNEPTAPLQVDYGSNPSGSVDVLKIGAVVGSGYDEEFRIKFYSGTASLGYIGGSHKDDGASGASQGYLAFGTRTGSAVVERLRIDHDGTQDHKANRIVNSQTLNDSWRSSEPSLRFDPNSYVLVNNSNQTWHGADFTYSVWVKTTHNSYQVPIELKHNAGTLTTSHTQIAIQSNGTVYTYLNSPSGNWQANNTSTSSQLVNDGKWHNIVWSHKYGTSNNKIYVDGVELSTATTASTVDIAEVYRRLYIGINRNDGDNAFNSGFKGEIKDVRIHNRAMEAAEIKGLYNGESTPFMYADAIQTAKLEDARGNFEIAESTSDSD